MSANLISVLVNTGIIGMREETVAGDPQPKPAAKKHEDPSLYCPCCSSRLRELKCKLICDRCGYYMSCSDHY